MKRLLTLFFTLTLVFLSGSAWAEEATDVKKTAPGGEIEDLKARIEALEKKAKDTEIVDELGHRLHPIHSIYGLKINGGLTATAQGVTHIKGAHARGAAAVSADLALESPVGENGRAVVVLDAQRGAGLKNLPPFFISPDGNPTGTNADIESFDNDTVHLTQVYYEHSFGHSLVVSVGQLDITGYFDSNGFANDERTQFLANTFVNNPAIEWGGTDNFYSPGVRVTWWPVESIDITVGAFEGNGDYVDAFDNPFYMAELNFALKPAGKEGNYRVYYWNRQGRSDAELANTADPDNAGLVKAENKGFGVSIDQMVTESIGVWLRAGEQRKKVAQFNA
ncbi:MAG TPA: carbohydrate porin, partial [Thermodesulfobacteriota bacterium]|nr:carbohydrate porin [Thermodesulfobacteriota bacterium]